MRFTTKIKDGSYMGTTHNPNTSIETDIRNCVQKLGQLEDIEEKLGIDLVTFFKILRMFDSSIKNGIHGDSYCVFPDGTKLVTDMGYIEEFIKEFKKLIKNYGKTWALTKEELL